MSTNEYDVKLVLNYLNGTLTDKQLEEFYRWVESNPQNEQLYFGIKSVFDSRINIDIEASWLRMEQKIKANRKQQKWTRTFLPYAASLLFLLSTVTSFLYYSNKQTQTLTYRYYKGKLHEAGELILPDSTKINLGPESYITHNSSYGEAFRVIELEGEAFFDVMPNSSSPFIVKMGKEKIEVLGTKFNVKSPGKFSVSSYDSESLSIITLVEGSLQFSFADSPDSFLLKPGEQLCYNRTTGKVYIEKVDPNLSICWISGYYRFEDENLENILLKLGRLYDVSFIIESPRLKSHTYTGTFLNGQPLNSILSIITFSSGAKYEIKGKTVHIKYK